MLETLKEKLNSENLNKKLIMYIGIGVIVLIVFLIILFFIKSISGNKISPEKLEEKIKSAAISYYEKNPDKLPKENGGKLKITIEELVEYGNLKSLDKLLDEGISCTGYVNVSKNNGYYSYIPYVDCGNDYKTNLLVNVIKNEKNVVTTGNGLYKMDDYYIFRGENLNNHVSFAGKNWFILRINSDNTIRLLLADKAEAVVWDDRYNTEKNYNVGKNNYDVSRIKESLENYFKSESFNDEERSLIVPTNLCTGKRKYDAKVNNGSIECSKIVQNQPLGLLQLNEYMLASIEANCTDLYSHQCTNYNYLATLSSSFWTITADASNSYKVYKISGFPTAANASSSAQLKVVATISSDVTFTKGDGSVENPYIIK